jgi:hypothetical protein
LTLGSPAQGHGATALCIRSRRRLGSEEARSTPTSGPVQGREGRS